MTDHSTEERTCLTIEKKMFVNKRMVTLEVSNKTEKKKSMYYRCTSGLIGLSLSHNDQLPVMTVYRSVQTWSAFEYVITGSDNGSVLFFPSFSIIFQQQKQEITFFGGEIDWFPTNFLNLLFLNSFATVLNSAIKWPNRVKFCVIERALTHQDSHKTAFFSCRTLQQQIAFR